MACAAKAPVWLIHGRQDLVAPPHLAEALATRLGAPCVRVDGAHFIPRENAIEVRALCDDPEARRGHHQAHDAASSLMCGAAPWC